MCHSSGSHIPAAGPRGSVSEAILAHIGHTRFDIAFFSVFGCGI